MPEVRLRRQPADGHPSSLAGGRLAGQLFRALSL